MSVTGSMISIGHDTMRAHLLRSFQEGKAAHAFLLTGPQGIGKATLARHMALHIFSENWSVNAVFDENASYIRRMHAGSHGDFFVLESEEGKDIPIDSVRRLNHFLSQTGAESQNRVVIVDGVERLNRNAANGLLKSLEEPHAGVYFFLISQNTGRVLPTLRSRCQVVAMSPLEEKDYHKLIIQYEAKHDLTIDPLLVREAEGSFGKLMILSQEGGSDFLRCCDDVLEGRGGASPLSIIGEASEAQMDLLRQKITDFIHRHILKSSGEVLETWLELWDKVTEIYNRVDRAQVDIKAAHLNIFTMLAKAQRSKV